MGSTRTNDEDDRIVSQRRYRLAAGVLAFTAVTALVTGYIVNAPIEPAQVQPKSVTPVAAFAVKFTQVCASPGADVVKDKTVEQVLAVYSGLLGKDPQLPARTVTAGLCAVPNPPFTGTGQIIRVNFAEVVPAKELTKVVNLVSGHPVRGKAIGATIPGTGVQFLIPSGKRFALDPDQQRQLNAVLGSYTEVGPDIHNTGSASATGVAYFGPVLRQEDIDQVAQVIAVAAGVPVSEVRLMSYTPPQAPPVPVLPEPPSPSPYDETKP